MQFTIEAKTIAEAIAQLTAAAGGTVAKAETTKDAAAPAPAKAPAPAPAPAKAPAPAPAPAPAAAAGMTLTEVRAKLTPLMTGANVPLKPVITQLINTYAAQLSAVPEDKFAELVARAEALGADFDNTGVVPTLS
mgnify:FL=1